MAAENKTKPTTDSVKAFLAAIPDAQMRADCEALSKMMEKAAKTPATMWGSIVGFGSYHYRYASGREGDSLLVGFRPSKGQVSVYIASGFDGYDALMAKLGKYKVAQACLYLKRLSDVDPKVLQKLIDATVKARKAQHVK